MGEQGKINQPEHTAGGSQNKGTEKLQRRAAPSPLEVGGGGEGQGANSAPEKPPPPTRQTGPGSCLKTSWESVTGRVAARGQLLWTDASLRHPTSGTHCGRGGERRASSGEGAPKPLAAWTAEAAEGTTRRRNRMRAFVGNPKTGPALNAGPAPYRAAGSLSSVDGEGSAPPPRGATEAANLNQRPPLPACVRAEIRHGRDPQTEAKWTTGTASEGTGAAD